MKVQHTATLDFTDNGVFETGWRIKQGDYGNTELVLRLVNNGVNVYDAEITPQIAFRRWDGASVISVMTPNDQTYKYAFAGNELEVPGLTLCDVKFTDAEGRVSTASCRFTVVEDTIGYDPTGAHTYDNPVSELVEQATNAAEVGIESSFKAEGFAVGEQGGVPVGPDSPYYHNNAKWWAQNAGDPIGTAVEEQTTTTGQFTTKTGGKLESCIVSFELVQSGSGDPSPSNVRPITGHSSVEVWEHGKNYLPLPSSETLNGVTLTYNDDRSITLTGTATSTTYFDFFPNGNFDTTKMTGYIFSMYPSDFSPSNNSIACRISDSSRSALQNVANGTAIVDNGSNRYIAIRVANGYNTNGIIFKPMLVRPTETATTYEPYQGQDVTVALGDTYYGGSLDVVSGVLTVTHGFLTENDFITVNTNTSTGGLHWTDVMISAITDTEVICNKIKTVPSTQGWGSTTPCIQEGAISASQYSVRIYCSESTLADFKTTYSGLQIVYKLPTPLIIQLTPQQINTLIGENNIDVPLTGQSLESAVYREMFTWSDILDAINAAVNA